MSDGAQGAEMLAVAQHDARPDRRTALHRVLGPVRELGATDRAGQDRQRRTGVERSGDRGDELDGGFSHEHDNARALVADACGDVLRPLMHLGPRMATPHPVVEHDEIVAAGRHRIGQR